VYEIEVGQEALVQFAALLTATAQPGTEGRFTDTDGFFDGRSVYAKSQQVKNKTHGSGMCFETIEHGVSSDGEFLTAGLAEQILDIFVFTMRTIANEGVDDFICDQIVGTSWIGTEVALGPDRFLLSAFAFYTVPGRGHMGAGVGDTLPAGENIPALRTILLALGLQLAGFWGR